ncbi:anaphase-promoting complex, cyclosome, subunit 4-domain-containing protein [Cokeromyces recurvatus]|uniref:anaphase-promoting complex, cyclosome, subunit 4-domain-containing protein n=1 Tax=Cokeromyces recurvatus TaxID=90255 RepID=UPI002220B302|nr:anaphase-promoting complex, cyclosome, subunit 4-domain-containing protein [Cokeromyces recurvatus]KAI7905959.1 anaphase-promoting complex, cyclosome, subunit 4-domain-containing protein [Cokeromyces recurvatus]
MPEMELITIAAMGNIKNELQEFFKDIWTTQRVKEWDTNVNHAYENSLKIVSEYIVPACERILVQLDKLLGYSLWVQRYGEFLESSSIRKCIVQAQLFLVKILEFSKSMNNLKKSFNAFIAWITLVVQHFYDSSSTEFENPPIVCESPELVLEFLDKEFTKDSMADYFDNLSELNLIQLLSNISDSCQRILEKPSTKVRIISVFPFYLSHISIDSQPRKGIISTTTVKMQIERS